jgi:hypothetical protein
MFIELHIPPPRGLPVNRLLLLSVLKSGLFINRYKNYLMSESSKEFDVDRENGSGPIK